jgi:hypothetical protein
LNSLCSSVKYQLTAFVWPYFMILCFVPLNYVTTFHQHYTLLISIALEQNLKPSNFNHLLQY